MIDLGTEYLGLKLENPIVASSSPLCEKLDAIRRMEDCGVGAVVLHSLFEEQLDAEGSWLDQGLSQGEDSYAESLSYFPDMGHYNLGPEKYLEHIRNAKKAVEVPIIASLNGASMGGWTDFSKLIEEAGADALELNIYNLPTDPNIGGREIEAGYVSLVKEIRSLVRIPIAVKLSHFFSAIPNMARRLDQAGAAGLVLFNRFYQPDFDIEHLEIKPSLDLSTPSELRLRLRWAAILYGHLSCDMAITGGIHSAEDVVKAIMAGANAAMMTSSLLKNGIHWLEPLRHNLVRWMEEREYDSIETMRGCLSRVNAARAESFERANYMKVLHSYHPKAFY